MQREMLNFKQEMIEKDNANSFHNMTLKAPHQHHRTLAEDNYGNLSFKGSPDRLGISSARVNNNMNENLLYNSRGGHADN
jgi:hypothetical protein